MKIHNVFDGFIFINVFDDSDPDTSFSYGPNILFSDYFRYNDAKALITFVRDIIEEHMRFIAPENSKINKIKALCTYKQKSSNMSATVFTFSLNNNKEITNIKDNTQ